MTANVYEFPQFDQPRPTRTVSLPEDEWNVVLAAMAAAKAHPSVDRAGREMLSWISQRMSMQLSHPSSQAPA